MAEINNVKGVNYPLGIRLSKIQGEIHAFINNVTNEYSLPPLMIEKILEGILLDYKTINTNYSINQMDKIIKDAMVRINELENECIILKQNKDNKDKNGEDIIISE